MVGRAQVIITDYCTVSTPLGNGPFLLEAVSDVVLQLPEAATDPQGVRVGKHGLLRYQERPTNGIATVSASGHVLALLRAGKLLADYCAAVACSSPYHVTHLDVARDEDCDAPSKLQWLYGRLRVAGCALTRKRVQPRDIKAMWSRGDDGRDTGSIMIGNRKRAETTAIIYDRRHDAAAKGKPDPGPLLRTEIRTGVAGMSLRDVWEPGPLFHHFASPELVQRPSDIADWQPWHERFDIERADHDVPERLQRFLDNSTDLKRMMALADQVPGDGLGLLQRKLAQAIETHRRTLEFTAVDTASRADRRTDSDALA